MYSQIFNRMREDIAIKLVFFILTTGLAFTLRGIWGHNLGGAIMGTLTGLALCIIFEIPLITGIELTFSLALAWAFASFVGWARKKTFQRFLRGYFAYGMIPALVIAHFFFNDLASKLWLIFISPIGMGIGFGMSYWLLTLKYRPMMEKKYPKVDGREIVWRISDLKNPKTQVNFVYVTKWDTWKFLLEEVSGLLFGLTTMIVLTNLSTPDFSQVSNVFQVGHIFEMLLIFVIVPLAAIITGIQIRAAPNEFNLDHTGEKRLSQQNKKKAILIYSIVAGSLAIFLISLVFLDEMQMQS